jgi:hypothetical protein
VHANSAHGITFQANAADTRRFCFYFAASALAGARAGVAAGAGAIAGAGAATGALTAAGVTTGVVTAAGAIDAFAVSVTFASALVADASERAPIMTDLPISRSKLVG